MQEPVEPPKFVHHHVKLGLPSSSPKKVSQFSSSTPNKENQSGEGNKKNTSGEKRRFEGTPSGGDTHQSKKIQDGSQRKRVPRGNTAYKN
jgi:hypothetical protein